MKNYLIVLAVAMTLTGCSPEEDSLNEITDYGGFVSFEQTPQLSYSIVELDSEVLQGTLYDTNGNAASYQLIARFDDREAVVLEVNSFPASFELSLRDILESLDIGEDQMEQETTITMIGEVTTTDGTIYNGLDPDYNDDNVNEGGDTTGRVKDYFPNQAMEFDITISQTDELD